MNDTFLPPIEKPKGPIMKLAYYFTRRQFGKGGKNSCAARLINKDKLESAVLAKIQEQILTPNNIRTYIERVMESAVKSDDKLSPEQEAIRLALNDL